jgi:hypothetical protein
LGQSVEGLKKGLALRLLNTLNWPSKSCHLAPRDQFSILSAHPVFSISEPLAAAIFELSITVAFPLSKVAPIA